MLKKYLPYFPAALIAICFLTVLLLFNFERGRSSYILFFPLDSREGKNAEIRKIYRARSQEARLELMIKEVILGPVELEMNPVLPDGTKLKALIWSDDSLYIDFNRYFFDESLQTGLSISEKIDYLNENIFFNFPGIKEIVITVEGQIPESVFFKIYEDPEQ